MKKYLNLLPGIEKKYDAHIVYYEGPVTEEGARQLRAALESAELVLPDVLLIIETTEGTVEGARQIIDTLMGPYGYHRIKLFVPNICTGPGALFAFVADSLILDTEGWIGQIGGSLNSELVSAKHTLSALEVLASQLTDADLTAAINQLNLQAIGRQHNDMKLAKEFVAERSVYDDRKLIEKLFGDFCGPSRLFNSDALLNMIEAEKPSEALNEFAWGIRAHSDFSGSGLPRALVLNSGTTSRAKPRRADSGKSRTKKAA